MPSAVQSEFALRDICEAGEESQNPMHRYPAFPDQVYVELTNTCNARCTICATPTMKRKRQVMDFDLFRKIIDECGKRRAFRILPFLHGETLLVPGVLDYFRYIRRVSPQSHINLTTNGSRLTGEISEAILREDLLDSVIFSVEGADRRTYELIRSGLSFEEVRSNFLQFLNLRRQFGKSKPHISVAMVLVDQNRSSKKEFAEVWKGADEVRFSLFFNWAGKLEVEEPRSGHRLNFCERLYHYVTILADGRVALCCFDSNGEYILGDVRNQTIDEVWHSQEFAQVRRQLCERKFDQLHLCARCDYIRHPAWVSQFVRFRPYVQKKMPRLANMLDGVYKRWTGI
jgi:radical SAM protein with 4Fe4S-binding SPASM domain